MNPDSNPVRREQARHYAEVRARLRKQRHIPEPVTTVYSVTPPPFMPAVKSVTDLVKDRIFAVIEREYGFDRRAIRGEGRQRRLMTARFIATWIMHCGPGRRCYSETARLMNREHSTIANALRSVARRWAEVGPEVERLAAELGIKI